MYSTLAQVTLALEPFLLNFVYIKLIITLTIIIIYNLLSLPHTNKVRLITKKAIYLLMKQNGNGEHLLIIIFDILFAHVRRRIRWCSR